jgi:hypothetical protein
MRAEMATVKDSCLGKNDLDCRLVITDPRPQAGVDTNLDRLA